MSSKFIGIFSAFSVLLSGLYLTPLPAVAEETNPLTQASQEISDVELPKAPTVESLVLNTETISDNETKVTVTSNVQNVSSQSPISLVDAEKFEILKVCVSLNDCAITVNTSEVNSVYAQSNDIISDTVSLNNDITNQKLLKVETTETSTDSSKIEIQTNLDSNYGVDLNIYNPVFEPSQQFALQAVSNKGNLPYTKGLYIIDVSNGAIYSKSNNSSVYNSFYGFSWAPELNSISYQDSSRFG